MNGVTTGNQTPEISVIARLLVLSPKTQKARDLVVAGLVSRERSRELVTALRRRAPPSLGVPFAGTPAGSCRSRARVGGPWPSLYHARVALPAAGRAASAGTIAGEVGGSQPHERESADEQRNGHVAEGDAPSHHAGAA